VRQLHKQIDRSGDSPARLGALVRGYANLDVLTDMYWHPAHAVFGARALLYAQRLLARDEKSPWARCHRAYALAAVGCHGLAIEDLKAARQAAQQAAGGKGVELPGWVPLVDAYCRFDLEKLDPGQAGKDYAQLAGLLRYFGLSLSGDGTGSLTAALELSKKMPECYTLSDGICRQGGVATGHAGTTAWIMVAGRTLYRRLAAMPGLPEEAARITREADRAAEAGGDEEDAPRFDAAKEFPRRAGLVRALCEAEKPGKAPGSSGEPSWACLGCLIRELAFIQVWHRAQFQARLLGVPTDNFLKLAAPLVAGHPYRPYLESFASGGQGGQAAAGFRITKTDALEIQEESMLAWYDSLHRGEKSLRAVLCEQVDETADQLGALMAWSTPDCFQQRTARLLATSPFSPFAKAFGIERCGDSFKAQFPAWEEEARRYPRMAQAMAHRALAGRRRDEAAKWFKAAIARSPSYDLYAALADLYRSQGKTDEWRATLEEYLKQPDYGLDHATVRVQIARQYMRLKQWDKATPYAQAAAETYASWALQAAAECFEARQDWKAAEEIYKAIFERYPVGSAVADWYGFCRRTGHGDVKAARQAAKDYFDEHPQERLPSVYVLEKDLPKARERYQRLFQMGHDPLYAMHVALLSDQLHEDAARDAALAEIKEAAARAEAARNAGNRVMRNLTGTTECVTALAGLITDDLAKGGKGQIDLAAADRLCEAAAKQRFVLPHSLAIHFPPPKLSFHYFLGCYLDLHGKPKEAIECWKKCVAQTQNMLDQYRTLAGAALCDHGILPESYKSLFAPGPEEANKEKDEGPFGVPMLQL
jgi:tetratricopeptide (TPR) repeat protein